MVNCNPETVSTDYDTSDRLYFEPLTEEHVLGLIRTEQKNGNLKGVIVQFGGQTPLKLAGALEAAGVPILGTSPDAIDLAEDRERFQALLHELKLRQPPNGIATSAEQARAIAEDIGFPVVIRPSYVLGGRAMEIVHDNKRLDRYMTEAVRVSGDSPVLIDLYLRNATEVDVDALCDGEDVFVAGIMEHIERGGRSLRRFSLFPAALFIKPGHSCRNQSADRSTRQRIKRHWPYECPVRDPGCGHLHSGSKPKGQPDRAIRRQSPSARPIAKIAARIMAGEKLASFNLKEHTINHVAVKEAVFPLCAIPGRGHIAGARNALHGRSDGPRCNVRKGVCKIPARGRHNFAD